MAIGCILEIGEATVEGLQWWWKKKGKPFLDDDGRWTIPLSIVGLILVIVGVAGEGYFEPMQSNAETAVRQFDEKQLGTAISDAAVAKAAVAPLEAEAACAHEKTAKLEEATEGLKVEAEIARRNRARAERELAIINGPPYVIPVSANGIAVPDLSKSAKQRIVLTRNTRMSFPTLPEGHSLNWTLIIEQDEKGQHQITTFPFDISHGNIQQAPPFSSRVCSLTTDSNGTRKADVDCAYNDPPTSSSK